VRGDSLRTPLVAATHHAPRTSHLSGFTLFPLCIAVLLACDADTGARAPASVEVGRPAPAYSAISLDGNSVSLEALRGTPVLLNVWATWCHPCRDEVPELQRLYERYSGRGLQLVGVSVDAAGTNDAIREFTRRYGMTYPVWRDPGEHVSATFLVIGVPATFLIDRRGVLRWKKTGPIQRGDSTLIVEIERALAASSGTRS
jgi:peroxiredoxin